MGDDLRDTLTLLIRIAAAAGGIAIIVISFFWSMRILMVQGADPPWMARVVLRVVRNAMFVIGMAVPERRRRQIWQLYAPVGLLAIVSYTLFLVLIGYSLLLFGTSDNDFASSYVTSASYLSTIGFVELSDRHSLRQATIGLIEAFTGPILVALLITYIASMNSSLTSRQAQLRAIELQVGRATSGGDLILRAVSGPGLPALGALWGAWDREFAWAGGAFNTVEGYLLLFAPNMQQIWISDTLMVLDAANLRNTLFTLPPDPVAADCLRSGAATITEAASHFHRLTLPIHHYEPTALNQDEFTRLYASLVALRAPVVSDQAAAFTRFRASQVTYEAAVHDLSRLMNLTSPPAPPDAPASPGNADQLADDQAAAPGSSPASDPAAAATAASSPPG